jgi:NAD(P)-dependent dehydrogenase (short-subunit alcohol dehydrogenase family)
MTEADWHRQLDVDLHGTFRVCRAAIPLLRRTGGGRIINFTDWVVASGRPRYTGYVAYYVAKAGVKALTEALALELAPDGILVNAIAPGPILPPPGTSEDERVSIAKATPLGRWGGAEELAKTIDALIDSDFITGETIRVDGGRHVR